MGGADNQGTTASSRMPFASVWKPEERFPQVVAGKTFSAEPECLKSPLNVK
jgi:hypothetical protein